MVDRGRAKRESFGPAARGRPGGRLPLASTLTLALVGLTLVLGLIAALGIGNLYSARQDYEDALARTYELEAASARLLAAGVVEEAALVTTTRRGEALRRRARDAFGARAADALDLARGDDASLRAVRERVDAEVRARSLARAARGRPSARARKRLMNALALARSAGEDLTARQEVRREAARDTAQDATRTALLTAAGAGVLALLGALALIAALIGSIRRPLDNLVSATQRLAAGDLSERVDPSGPRELRELDMAFNTMADRLQRAQQRVEAEREKLSVTIESLGDALVVCDSQGRVSAVNRRAEEIVPALSVGVDVRQDPGILPELREALEAEVVVDQGARTLSITAARLGDGEGVVWALRDISERARLDRMKSDFVATASHELRSPLTSIKGFVELLDRSESLGPREQEFVGVILQSTDRLVDLVNDLLDVARLEAGRMEVHPRLFDLAEVIHEVAALMGPRLAAKDQRLDLDLPPGLPRALADPMRVRQIVINLVSNAHQYTHEGGRITVTADREGTQLAVAVADDGRGMTQEDMDHVFERFVRRGEGGHGTGLGLSIVRSLVELQGGSIDVRSARGEGTTFTVLLPAEPAHPQGLRESPRQALRGKRVLVVDDEEGAAHAIAAGLGPYEVETEIATSRDLALARLRTGRFDAITLDVLMEGASGLEVLRTVREDEQLRGMPLVVVSAAADEQALLGEEKLTKPIDPELLADTLGAAVLAGRTRVLVVGRSSVRPRLEPALVRIGLDHEWVASARAAAEVCRRRRFEAALVDAGMREPESVLRSLDLRGRRRGQAVVIFSTGDEADGEPAVGGGAAVPIEEAAEAVLAVLRQGDCEADAPRAGGGPVA